MTWKKIESHLYLKDRKNIALIYFLQKCNHALFKVQTMFKLHSHAYCNSFNATSDVRAILYNMEDHFKFKVQMFYLLNFNGIFALINLMQHVELRARQYKRRPRIYIVCAWGKIFNLLIAASRSHPVGRIRILLPLRFAHCRHFLGKQESFNIQRRNLWNRRRKKILRM